MSKSGNNLGKPLAGIYTLAPSISDTVATSVASSINNGSTVFSNITITGGSIDGVVIGQNNPVILNATTITSGTGGGVGYSVCFYGNIIGDSACWIPTIGQWNIQGDLLVRDISDLGNLRINGNTISSTLSNSDIILSPNITNVNTPNPGKLSINSGINQTTTNGDLIFNTTKGKFQLTTSQSNTLTSKLDTRIITTNGDISLITGTAIPNYNISTISTGTGSITITTNTPNTLIAGDTITISGSNSFPSIDSTYDINSILSNTSFTITPNTPIVGIGTTGTITSQKNIYLSATNNIYVPTSVPIVFGNNNTGPSLMSDGTTTTLTSPNVVIQGNLTVHGTTIQSNIVTVDDPVFNVGGTSLYSVVDNMDRGVSFQYYKNGTTNYNGFFGRNNGTGCFTYIPDATESSNNVFTGTPGCAVFGALTISSLSLSGTATITNINTCNITCNTNLSITSPNTTISGTLNVCNINCNSGNLTINSGGNTNISSTGTTTVNNLNVTGTTTGISLNQVQQIEHITVATNVNTNPTANTNMTFINTSGTSVVYTITSIPAGNYSGPITIACLNSLSSGNSITINGVNSLINGNYNVTSATNATFTINFTGLINTQLNNVGSVTVNATGILLPPSVDGFEKKILCSSLANGILYSLKCPAGVLLDPQTGSTIEKFIDFEYPAQSAYLIYDAVNGYYIPVSVNACTHS